MKGFADSKVNMTEKLKFVLRKVENIVRKGENAGYQKASYAGLLKVVVVWKKVNCLLDDEISDFLILKEIAVDIISLRNWVIYTRTKKKCRVHQISNIIISLLGLE